MRNIEYLNNPNVSDNFLRAFNKGAKRDKGFHQKLKPKML
jgi:hypothetical protein